jgi:DNA-binding transcriptional LysR family regulator
MSEKDAPVDVTLLLTFYEVARLGSVTAAARVLARSQPAVSHRLRALEEELGAPLFEKVGRRLLLTELGRRVEASCADLLALCRSIRASAASGVEAIAGSVRVGTFPAMSSRLLAPMVGQLARRYPELQLEFVLELGGALIEALRSGRVDLLVILGYADLQGLEVERVGVARLLAVMAPELAPEGAGPIAPAALSQRRYLSWSGPSDPTFERVQQYVETWGLTGATSYRIPHIETLRELAAAGAGYTVLPDYTVAAEVTAGRLVARPLVGLDEEMPMWLVGRQGQVMGAALREVRRVFREGLGGRLR